MTARTSTQDISSDSGNAPRGGGSHAPPPPAPSGATARLAGWVAERGRTWDDAALHWAEMAFLDTVGCMLAGAADPASTRVAHVVADFGGADAGLITGGRANILWAALVNGTAAHALDYDDVALQGLNHLSAALVPAILACGEKLGASGMTCLEAYLVGYEVTAALGSAYNPGHYNKGWHTTLSMGACGVAAAISRLLNLSAAQAHDALALSTSMAGGTKAQFGSMAKPLHAGLAGKNGTFAAMLASAGLSAANEAFDGVAGYGSLTSGVGANGGGINRLADILDTGDLGCSIDQHGLWFKAYPCCGSTHGPIGAVLRLAHEHGLAARSVDRVRVRMAADAAANLPFSVPASAYEARFCLPYCLAVALTDGPPRLSHFTPQGIGRDDLLEVAKRVEIVADPAITLESNRGPLRHPTFASIRLQNRAEFETTFWEPLGHPLNPMSDAELLDKFRDCAAYATVDPERSAVCAEKLLSLRQRDSVADLIGDLVSPSAKGIE